MSSKNKKMKKQRRIRLVAGLILDSHVVPEKLPIECLRKPITELLKGLLLDIQYKDYLI